MIWYGKKPLLQLALDMPRLGDALEIAVSCADYVDIIEVGTPLLKYAGVGAIQEIRDLLPDKPVFADTKTMDAGILEAEIVFKAGADIMSVCAAAPLETVVATAEVAHELGKEVALDCIGLKNYGDAMLKAAVAQPDLICVHRGVDERRGNAGSWVDLLENLGDVSIPLMLAGGIEPPHLSDLMIIDMAIIAVGGYVTSSPFPAEAAAALKQEIDRLFQY